MTILDYHWRTLQALSVKPSTAMTELPVPWLSDHTGKRHALHGAHVRLGRALDNEIVIPDTRASREHARIGFDKHRVWVEDLDSANGTWLNGKRLTQRMTLKEGDQLMIGGVKLTYHDPNATYRDPALATIELDEAAGLVRMDQRSISLPPKELALFKYLYARRGQVCSKAEIAAAIWPEYKAGAADYQIENLVRRLRTSLEPDTDTPTLIETLRGHGYRFN